MEDRGLKELLWATITPTSDIGSKWTHDVKLSLNMLNSVLCNATQYTMMWLILTFR